MLRWMCRMTLKHYLVLQILFWTMLDGIWLKHGMKGTLKHCMTYPSPSALVLHTAHGISAQVLPLSVLQPLQNDTVEHGLVDSFDWQAFLRLHRLMYEDHVCLVLLVQEHTFVKGLKRWPSALCMPGSESFEYILRRHCEVSSFEFQGRLAKSQRLNVLGVFPEHGRWGMS